MLEEMAAVIRKRVPVELLLNEYWLPKLVVLWRGSWGATVYMCLLVGKGRQSGTEGELRKTARNFVGKTAQSAKYEGFSLEEIRSSLFKPRSSSDRLGPVGREEMKKREDGEEVRARRARTRRYKGGLS